MLSFIKPATRILLFVGLTLCISSLAHSQSAPSLDALKKENQKLKSELNKLKDDTTFLAAKLKFCDALNQPRAFELKGISNSIDIDVLSCVGDRNNQTVKIEYLITHQLVHQHVCIASDTRNVKAYDEMGNEIPMKAADIGTNSEGSFTSARCNKIPTEIPVKGYIIFSSILPSTDLFKFVTAAFKFKNYDSKSDYAYGTLEIKNLKIKW